MINRTIWTGESIPALGLGTWAIGGPFFEARARRLQAVREILTSGGRALAQGAPVRASAPGTGAGPRRRVREGAPLDSGQMLEIEREPEGSPRERQGGVRVRTRCQAIDMEGY
jgi:hypothetical protein